MSPIWRPQQPKTSTPSGAGAKAPSSSSSSAVLSALGQPANRLREWRTAARMSLQDLANLVGTSKSQIDKLERGQRRMTVDWLMRLAAALGVSANDLLPGAAPVAPLPSRLVPITTLTSSSGATNPSPNLDLPVVGSLPEPGDVNASYFFGERAAVEHIARPPALVGVPNAFAVYVRNTRMTPRFFPGEIVYVNPNKPVVDNCFVVAEFQDGSGLIAQYIGRTSNTIRLKKLNPHRDMILNPADIKHLWRIVGISEAS